METEVEQSFELVSLAERPDLRPAFLVMIEKFFPKGSPLSRKLNPEEEFSLLLAPENASRNLMLIDPERPKNFSTHPICAISSYRIFDVLSPAQDLTLRFAGVGLVCTHADFRKQGLGHRLQVATEARAKSEGAAVSVLWSDLLNYYTSIGYVVAGNEAQWLLDKSELQILLQRFEAENQRELFDIVPLKDFSDVQDCYKQSRLGPLRDAGLYSKLLELPNTFAYQARSKNSGATLGYAVMGKARDLRDTIHEILGPKECVAPLLKELAQHSESGLRLYHPPASPLVSELEHWLGAKTTRAMAFFKVLDGPLLIDWINQAKLLPQGITLRSEGRGFNLGRMHVTFFDSKDSAHLLQLFFGPWSISELDGLPELLHKEMGNFRSVLPIYFWGLDSV